MTLELRSPWLLGHCSSQLRQSCAGENMAYSRTECVSILEHYSTLKSFAAAGDHLAVRILKGSAE